MFPHNGWTYNFAVNKELNTPMAIPEGYYHDPIVIYPEIIMGNPLGGRRVVRYILGQKDNPTLALTICCGVARLRLAANSVRTR